jgi:hypothetical protein
MLILIIVYHSVIALLLYEYCRRGKRTEILEKELLELKSKFNKNSELLDRASKLLTIRIDRQTHLDPDIQDLVTKHFWELF